MARISDEDIQRVREASDLVAIAGERVVLRQKKGYEYWGCCPFHNEKSPSFKIDANTQLWHCFGCSEGGDVFSFIMKMDDLGFLDAVRELARRAGIQLSENPGEAVARGRKARLKDVCRETAEFYHTMLMRTRGETVDAARAYLSGRDLGGKVPNEWQLGFAPGSNTLVNHLRSKGFSSKEMIDANVAVEGRGGAARDRFYNRIMFPIRDVEGEVIAFGGRVIGKGEPKYLNSQETPIFHKSNVLYGLDKAKATMASTGVAIICEGYTDVIMMHKAGVTNVVATLGTALTIQHIRALSRHAKHKIIYLFDGDEAGQRAADRAARFVDESMLPESGRKQVSLCAVTLPDNLDPADFITQRGPESMQTLLDDAVPLMQYAIDRKLKGRNLSDFSESGRALSEILELLAPIKSSILAQQYVNYAADKLGLSASDVSAKLAATPAPRAVGQDQAAKPAAPVRSATQNQLSPKQRQRLTIERDFLALVATNPQVGLSYANTLAQTNWRLDAHTKIAAAMLDVLAADAQVCPADFVRKCEELVPGAGSILSGSSARDAYEPVEYARFYSEELYIRDMEDTVNALNVEMKNSPELAADELAYQSLVAIQKELVDAKKAHHALGA